MRRGRSRRRQHQLVTAIMRRGSQARVMMMVRTRSQGVRTAMTRMQRWSGGSGE
jgi:hypothetical protein